jgi:hypothetical protein
MNALMTLASTLWSLLRHEGFAAPELYLKERQGIRTRAMFSVKCRGTLTMTRMPRGGNPNLNGRHLQSLKYKRIPLWHRGNPTGVLYLLVILDERMKKKILARHLLKISTISSAVLVAMDGSF